jgi:hypothetical protein
MRFRVIATLAVVVAAVGVLVGGVSNAAASTKGAYEPNYNYAADPQTTNIPWVAWAGETVKVARCFGLGDSQVNLNSLTDYASKKGFDPLSVLTGEFDKSDWSGATDQPPFFQIGTGDETSRQVQAYWDPNGGICFATDVTSEKAGMERIKFSISLNLGEWINFELGQDVIFQQDLYVIWMWDSAPTLTESGDVGAYAVGDPGGSGTFDPIADSSGHKTLQPGLIQATVTGTFPMGNDFANYDFTGTTLDNGTITLPNDWLWLAQNFAEDYTLASEYPGAAWQRWDIHDDDAATEGHVPASLCPDQVTSTSIDAVDTCYGIGTGDDPDLGPFSSIFGPVGLNNDAWGPFDPIRSFETLLSDGKVDASDAPMPALRLDVSLTNAGADHSVGTLSKADKSLIFNRNDAAYGGNGSDLGDPHMMYAPFYKAYIPSVVPILSGNFTSGVEGSIGGNYGNWLTSGAYDIPTTEQYLFEYDYWDTFDLQDHNANNDCYGADGNPISQPNGATSVAVYTDEHGEAYVQFNPANEDGEGIYLTPDANGRCDVYTGSLVGTATIQALSVYPAQQPADPNNTGSGGKPPVAKQSNVLTKTVDFTPNKVLSCVPKGSNEAYCVETVTDFEGNPIKAEVEFTASANANVSIAPDFAKFSGYDPSGQTESGSGVGAQGQYVDLWTNPATGEAAVAIHSSLDNCVDVSAENIGTRHPIYGSDNELVGYNPGIFRDFDFNPHAGTACGTNTGTGPTGDSGNPSSPPSSGGSTTTGSSTSTAQNAATPVSVTAPAPTAKAPTIAPKTTKKVAKLTLVSAHVVATHTGRFLNVRVNSTAKMAKLRITLVSKTGAKRVITRYVKTNKVVRVANLKLAPSVKTVRVALA